MFDFGDLAGVGINAGTGNYVGAAVSAVGLGMSIFGGSEQANIAHEKSAYSSDIAQQELGINQQKQQAMELAGRRQQLEIVRNGQRARALAENNATNQGAQFGSGLQGGLAQVTDDALTNLLGVNQSLEIGRNINAFNTKISQDKMRIAQLGGDEASAAGFSSLGGSIMKAGPYIGNLSGGFGSSRSGGGNYSGTPGASNTGGLY